MRDGDLLAILSFVLLCLRCLLSFEKYSTGATILSGRSWSWCLETGCRSMFLVLSTRGCVIEIGRLRKREESSTLQLI
jgi:hypothetical protein